MSGIPLQYIRLVWSDSPWVSWHIVICPNYEPWHLAKYAWYFANVYQSMQLGLSNLGICIIRGLIEVLPKREYRYLVSLGQLNLRLFQGPVAWVCYRLAASLTFYTMSSLTSQSVVKLCFYERKLQVQESEKYEEWKNNRPADRILEIGTLWNL